MLEQQQPAPEFAVPNQDNDLVKLSDYRGKQNVVLYFYPKDDTPGCTIEANQFTALADQFAARKTEKRYLAVVRGWVETEGWIDHPVADQDASAIMQPAETRFNRLGQIELPHAVDRYPTSRYSLVCIEPVTGRRQQIRKHFKHISHHLIGDTTHGNGRHNRFFREHFGIRRLMLMAWRLRFNHPRSDELIEATAPFDADWQKVLHLFGCGAEGLKSC